MEKNFKVGQSNELIKGGKIFDLHNCYDFLSLHIESSEAKLNFEPNSEYCESLTPLAIKFIDLQFIALSKNFCSSKCMDLEEMGYKHPGDENTEWLLQEEQSNHDDHFYFRFEGGQTIRLFATRAELVT